MRPLPIGSAVLLAALLAAGAALADQPSREAMAAAEVAFDEGKRLVKKGQYAEACPKLEESQRLAPASGTLLNLADCYEKLGRTATAWATFRETAAAARAKKQKAREDEARSRAAALEPRLSKLSIVVSDEARLGDLEVRRGEVVVGPSLWGVPVPVDPGKIAVSARAAKRVAWSQDVEVPSAPEVIEISVPRLQLAPDAAPPATKKPEEAPLGAQRTVALVVAGVGVVALSVGVAVGVDAIATKDASNDPAQGACSNGFCPPAGVDLRDEAVTKAHLSTGLFIGGGVALAGAAALWLTAPTTRVKTGVEVSPRGAGIRLGAAW